MKLDTQPPITASDSSTSDLLDPLEIIDAMLNLRAQLAELQQQVDALQPAFYAACAALQLEKIATDRATISRRLTLGKWDYSDEIIEQEDLLKQLKAQFQQAHEPIGGREVYWMIKFLLATV
ncbi:hypothetical protein [Leptolyngbya sp. FACHB-711]|uniref:hypothetical protein n=1 Tax=Leptolyngbya sp. FACHB-711 TaxID=2692813 RepID=UPI001689F4DB|nr:hypothetical protein [Leptolyngbya sp. FACHB-711]MBD2022923.1 hypothetical protein [Leptolyngbya sp. FACHB-711]